MANCENYYYFGTLKPSILGDTMWIFILRENVVSAEWKMVYRITTNFTAVVSDIRFGYFPSSRDAAMEAQWIYVTVSFFLLLF